MHTLYVTQRCVLVMDRIFLGKDFKRQIVRARLVQESRAALQKDSQAGVHQAA